MEPSVTFDDINWNNYFTLLKESERVIKKFNTTVHRYRVQIHKLPVVFDPLTSILAMPYVLSAVTELCTAAFQPNDRISIALNSKTLELPIYLTVRKLSEYNIESLMQKIVLLNSKKKFCIDDSFDIKIDQTVLPSGGAKAKHVHTSIDRRRFSHSIVQVDVKNNLCLPACLVLGRFRYTNAISGKDRKKWNCLIDKRVRKLERMACELVQDAEFTVGTKFGIEHLAHFQSTTLSQYQVKVISLDHGNAVIASVPEKRQQDMKVIYLLLEKGHFDLITTPTGYFRSNYYCNKCDKPFHRKETHRCGAQCTKCYRHNEECQKTNLIHCDECLRTFNNNDCFNIHKRKRKNGASLCEHLFVCRGCNEFQNLLRKKVKTHHCGEKWCVQCAEDVIQPHACFIKTLPPKPVPTTPKHIYFDFETFLDKDGVHKPCYVVAQYVDGQEFRFPPDGTAMAGYDTVNEFGKWVFSEQHKGVTLVAHNLRGYDGNFILSYLLENHLRGVNVIRKGNQFFDIQYAKLKINARDTLNFVMTKLSKFPRAVGLDITVQKGEFPHHLNKPENFDKILPFPELEMYSIGGLIREEKEKFIVWHTNEKLRKASFDFRSELSTYCSTDVTLLRKCALQFRQSFVQLTGIDPFESVTVASACLKYFRTYILKDREIAVISGNGYQPNRKTSREAVQWLEYLMHTQNIKITHGRNGKEHSVGKKFVDGYDSSTNTVYEYNGCVHHGHPVCTQEDDMAPFSKKKMKEVYEEWCVKKQYLERQGFQVEEKWSCEWLMERKEESIACFLNGMNLRDVLQPRNAFKGGRTNAARLQYHAQPGEKILHYDIVSLYPYVNKTGEYPIGHPEMIVSEFKPVAEYFGFVNCKVLPPDSLYFPVLPTTVNNKLLFALCNACACEGKANFCKHSDADRCLTGTWCTPELHHAMERGYKVIELYEVWHWPQRKRGLFEQYINTFLKEKLEASGWPEDCTTQEEHDSYIQQVKEKERVDLDLSRVEDNPGRKAVAKLMLNSFWGKFGQRDNLQQTEFIYSPKKFFDLLLSEAIEVHSYHAVTEECMMVTSSKKDDYNGGKNIVNVPIAAFTTSMARLKLLDMMEKLEKRVLYYDTDSVIFIHRPTDWLPPTGTFLGDWSNELEAGETHITKFVSCGPKVYCYQTNTGRYELKVKGMTQNGYTEDILNANLARTGKQLNYDLLDSILHGEIVPVVYPEYFKKDGKLQEIRTITQTKRIQMVYDKRILFPDFTTLPFGTN